MRQKSSQIQLLTFLLAITLAVSVAADDADIFACQDQRINSSNQKQCYQCYAGYNLENPKSCIVNFQSVCNISSAKTCTMNFCLYEVQQYMYQYYQGWAYYWVCNQCAYPYSVNEGACAYYCKYTGTYTSISNCKPTCYVENCDLCTEDNSSFCKTCASDKLLQNGSCVSQCSDGYYKDGINCLKCSPFCQTCTSLTTCGICTASNGLPSSCQCPSGTSLLNSICVSCPYQYRPNSQNVCERMCTQPQYAILNSDGSLNQCQDINSSDNQYCLNNLFQLKNGVKATLRKESTLFVIQFQIQQTPQVCYQYSLFGVQQSFPTFTYQQNEDYLVSFYFQQYQVDSGEIECSFTDCKVFLRIYWGGQIQYIFVVKIDINLTAILSNTISYNGNYQVVSIVCEDCQIPSTQITPSSLSTTCGSGQVCSNNLIETPIGSIVTITQKVTNSTLIHNTLTPHSLKFDYVDQTTQQAGSFYLKNYTFTNNIQGQITYSFIASAISNGQMTITSIITNAVVGRMLESTISSVTYPQLQIGIRSSNDILSSNDSSYNSEQQQEQDPESSSGTVILVVVVIILLIALSATSFYFYRKSKKQQQQLPTQNADAQVNDSKIKKSNQLELDQQASKDIQELPIDFEVKIKYIEGVFSQQDNQGNNTSGMEAKSKVIETDTLVQIPQAKEDNTEQVGQIQEEVINIELKEEDNHQLSNKEVESQQEVSNLPGIINLNFSDSESNSSQE